MPNFIAAKICWFTVFTTYFLWYSLLQYYNCLSILWVGVVVQCINHLLITQEPRIRFQVETMQHHKWLNKQPIKFGYSCSLYQILHSWYRVFILALGVSTSSPLLKNGGRYSIIVLGSVAVSAVSTEGLPYISVVIKANSFRSTP